MTVFRGDKDKSFFSSWVLGPGHVDDVPGLYFKLFQGFTYLLGVGEVIHNQSVSVRNYEERQEIDLILKDCKIIADSLVQQVLKFTFVAFKGTGANLLKIGSKRRRRQAEIEEATAEELIRDCGIFASFSFVYSDSIAALNVD